MGNDLTGAVHTVDTAATITTTSVKLKKMIWFEPTTAAHDLTVNDGLDNEIWDIDARNYGNGVAEEIDFGDGLWFSGLKVATIDSGTLKIYYA